MAFHQIERTPVYRQVAAQIRDAILDGQLAPGDPLPTERELCERLGVSRASVREALRALQAQGLVAGGGAAPLRTVVAEPVAGPVTDALVNLVRLQRVSLADLVGLRCTLESEAVRVSAGLVDDGRLDDARHALAEMLVRDVSVGDFDQADVRFHVALVRSSRNEAMHLVMTAVREAMERHLLDALNTLPQPARRLRGLAAEHRAILDAVESGDGDRAAQLLREHITGFYSRFIPREVKAS